MISFDELEFKEVAVFNVLALPLVQPYGTVISYERLGREDHMLFYMTKGERSYAQNGEVYLRMQAGDVLLLPGGSRYTSIVTSAADSKGFFTRFNLMDFEGKKVFLEGVPQLLLSDSAGQFLSAFEELARYAMQSSGILRASALLCGLISDLIEARRQRDLLTESIDPALNYMRTHLQQPASLPLLANLCHMSERTFCRRFQAETGMPPVAYHRRLRIVKAKELLESGIYTVEQTAEALGFVDTAHFSRTFFKMMGFPAGSIRKPYPYSTRHKINWQENTPDRK